MSRNFESLLTERDVARLLNVSVATLRRRRLFRHPPEFVKIGASVRYRPDAVRSLIDSAAVAAAGGDRDAPETLKRTSEPAEPETRRVR
jgi:hypothetical protein